MPRGRRERRGLLPCAPRAALLGAALLAAPAQGAGREGRVVQVTRARAYLDAGSAEGLSAGATVELRRGGGPAGRCKVTDVADHHASCVGAAARVGDSFALPGAQGEAPMETLRAAEPDAAARARQTATLQQAQQPLVPFTPGVQAAGLFAGGGHGEVQLGHATWASAGTGPWHEERLDVNLRGVPLGSRLSLWVDMSARHWTRQGDVPGQARFRPDTPNQLYVWEAMVTARGPGSWTGSLGRILPWVVPGAVRMDGAQVGYHTSGGQEFGLFGGALPDPGTLAPTLDRGTVGAYWSLQRRGVRDGLWPTLLSQGRISLLTTPEGGQRVTGEAAVQASVTRNFDFSGDLRVGAGGSSDSGLEAARVDFSARPSPRLSLTGGLRYLGVSLPEYAGPGSTSGGKSYDFDGAVTYEVFSALQASASGGYTKDLATGLLRGWAGPELALPRLFGDTGGISAGYREERGWWEGKALWLQSVAQPWGRLRLLARLTWTRDWNSDGVTQYTVGLFGSLSAKLAEHVDARLTFYARLDPTSHQQGVPNAQGGFVDAGLGGSF